MRVKMDTIKSVNIQIECVTQQWGYKEPVFIISSSEGCSMIPFSADSWKLKNEIARHIGKPDYNKFWKETFEMLSKSWDMNLRKTKRYLRHHKEEWLEEGRKELENNLPYFFG